MAWVGFLNPECKWVRPKIPDNDNGVDFERKLNSLRRAANLTRPMFTTTESPKNSPLHGLQPQKGCSDWRSMYFCVTTNSSTVKTGIGSLMTDPSPRFPSTRWFDFVSSQVALAPWSPGHPRQRICVDAKIHRTPVEHPFCGCKPCAGASPGVCTALLFEVRILPKRFVKFS